MNVLFKNLCAASTMLLVSSTAMAAISDIEQMADGSAVTLSGTVEDVANEREFTIRDNTGEMDVNITSNQSVVLKKGAQVTVSGTLDKGLTGTEIAATDVKVEKKLTEAMDDAVKAAPGVSMGSATVYRINELPEAGSVKVSGTVDDVDSEKKFTLRDATGRIKVKIESEQAAALQEGSEVTVIGNMDSGLLGRNIIANRVMVTGDTSPMTNNQPGNQQGY